MLKSFQDSPVHSRVSIVFVCDRLVRENQILFDFSKGNRKRASPRKKSNDDEADCKQQIAIAR